MRLQTLSSIDGHQHLAALKFCSQQSITLFDNRTSQPENSLFLLYFYPIKCIDRPCYVALSILFSIIHIAASLLSAFLHFSAFSDMHAQCEYPVKCQVCIDQGLISTSASLLDDAIFWHKL